MKKDFTLLAKDLEKTKQKLIKNLVQAQSESIDELWSEIYSNANRDTGEYALSIYRKPPQIEGNVIHSAVGSSKQVVDLSGKSYNLAWLLETGTDPHMIYPVNHEYLHFVIDGKHIYTKQVKHPGTRAYNTFQNAMNKVRPRYNERIEKAIEESLK